MNKLILEIMKLALEKNSEQKNTIFVWFSGHTQNFQVQIHKNGWTEENKVDFDKQIYLDIDKNVEQKLKEIIEYLKEMED